MSVYAFGQGLSQGLGTGMDLARFQEEKKIRADNRQYQNDMRQIQADNMAFQQQRQQNDMGFRLYENRLREHQRELGLLINARSSAEQAGNRELVKRLDESLLEGINRTPRLNRFINQGAPEGGYKRLSGFKGTGDGRFAIGVDTFDANDKKISSAFLSRDRGSEPDDPYLLADRESGFRFLHDNPDVAPYVIEALREKQQLSVKDRIDIYKAAHEYADAQGKINFEEKDPMTGEIVPQHIIYQRAYQKFLASFGIKPSRTRDPLSAVFGPKAASGNDPNVKKQDSPPPPKGFMGQLNDRQQKATEERNAKNSEGQPPQNNVFMPYPEPREGEQPVYHQIPWFPIR